MGSADDKKKRKRDADDAHDVHKKKRKSEKLEATTDAPEPSAANGELDEAALKAERKRKKKEKRAKAAQNSDDVAADEDERMPDAAAVDEVAADDAADKARRKEEKKRKKAEAKAKAAAATPTSSASSKDVAGYLEEHHIALSDAVFTPILAFDQLSLSAELRTCLSTFKEPTPIQACTWPPLLAGRDVVGIAETGSGKTLAFGLPALSHILSLPGFGKEKKKERRLADVLVVAPTRELAMQTFDTIVTAGKPLGVDSICVYGGVDKESQRKALGKKGVHVICGTPGRILDLAEEGVCDLSNVSYLVLDEADRMLDKGFENDIRRIIGQTKDIAARQTVMFSATWPESVRQLASEFMRDPVRVTVGSEDLTANKRVEQIVEVFEDARSKDTRTLDRLKKHFASKKGQQTRVLVFALYKKEAARVESTLRYKGYSVGALHGDLNQANRTEALNNFKTGVTTVLVATDVAARGLDIAAVDLVINYTFPLTVEDYVHRIGRTGRGGRSGQSVTFFTGENHERALAGEFAAVLREGGVECKELQEKFPMTIKKKEHSFYGAFFNKGDVAGTATKIKFT
ncbi:DEAD-domain-containing protein [Exidia glandulosa HHB12029]|uniref:RNA helicase n=1 Tax=Exidia glandulosa HHB12029 TaxID=1314781 RepID=A0A165PFB1_EXIGL|nr:DEAD-domain-containing protein [Exidia glandulosa HHB12029]